MDQPAAAPLIRVMRLDGFDAAVPLPAYATAGAAGADLRANLPQSQRQEGLKLLPGTRALVPTGIALAVPPEWEAQIRPRSGLALHHGIALVNAPGTIDSDYRGPVGVILVNLGTEPHVIAHGDRIAQIVIAPAPQAAFAEVATLDTTARGESGFGSTGRG